MSARLELNLAAKPKAPPPAVAPVGTIQLKVGAKYVLISGEVITMTKQGGADGDFLSNQGWWYRPDGKFQSREWEETYLRHVAKEYEEVLNFEQAMEKHMKDVPLAYRHKNILGSKWSPFPLKLVGGVFANVAKMKAMYGNSLEFKVVA